MSWQRWYGRTCLRAVPHLGTLATAVTSLAGEVRVRPALPLQPPALPWLQRSLRDERGPPRGVSLAVVHIALEVQHFLFLCRKWPQSITGLGPFLALPGIRSIIGHELVSYAHHGVLSDQPDVFLAPACSVIEALYRERASELQLHG